MARIPILRVDDPTIAAHAKLYLEDTGKVRGRPTNFYRAMANRPEVGRVLSLLANTVYQGTTSLDLKHGELAYLTATVVNNCHY